MKNKYYHYLGIQGTEFTATPINSDDVEFQFKRLEEPWHDVIKELGTDIKYTRASMSSELLSSFIANVLKQKELKAFYYVYENENLIFTGTFSGYDVEVDDDNKNYSIKLNSINIYTNLFANLDTIYEAISAIKANEITVSAPTGYTYDIQGCCLLTDVLTDLANRYIEDSEGFECAILTDENNTITGDDNKYRKIAISASSNVIASAGSTAYSKATSLKLTLADLINDMYRMFNMRMYIENNKLIARNYTEIRQDYSPNNICIDLTDIYYSKYFQNKDKYGYSTANFPERETLYYNESDYYRFDKASIVYNLKELDPKSNAEQKYQINGIADLRGVLINPDAFSKDGWCYLQIDPDSATNEVIETTVTDDLRHISSYSVIKGNSLLRTASYNRTNFISIDTRSGESIIASNNTFSVNTGGGVNIDLQLKEIFPVRSDVDGVREVKSNRVSVFIADKEDIDAGVAIAYSNTIVYDFLPSSEISWSSGNIVDNKYIRRLLPYTQTLIATANITNAVICFKTFEGYTYYEYNDDVARAKVLSETLYIEINSVRILTTAVIPNYDLRPSNLLRVFYQSGRYFQQGNIESAVDSGIFHALDTIKVKDGVPFKIPVDDINSFDINGFVVSKLGNDGEIATAKYNLFTQNLSDISVLYDKSEFGATDILRLVFDEQVSDAVINFDSNTINTTISKDGDINNIENWNITTSAGATYVVFQTVEDYIYSVIVTNGNNETQWTVYIEQEYDLSLQILDQTTGDAIDVRTGSTSNMTVYSNAETSVITTTDYDKVTNSATSYFFNFLFDNANDVVVLIASTDMYNVDLSILANLANVIIRNRGGVQLEEIIFNENASLSQLQIDSENLTDIVNLSLSTYASVDIDNIQLQVNTDNILTRIADTGTTLIYIAMRTCAYPSHKAYEVSFDAGTSDTNNSTGDIYTSNCGRGLQIEVTDTVMGFVNRCRIISGGENFFIDNSEFLKATWSSNPMLDTGLQVYHDNFEFEVRLKFLKSTNPASLIATEASGPFSYWNEIAYYYDSSSDEIAVQIVIDGDPWAKGPSWEHRIAYDDLYHTIKVVNKQLYLDGELVVTNNRTAYAPLYNTYINGFTGSGSPIYTDSYNITWLYYKLKSGNNYYIYYPKDGGGVMRYDGYTGVKIDISSSISGGSSVSSDLGFTSDGNGVCNFNGETCLSELMNNLSANFVQLEIF